MNGIVPEYPLDLVHPVSSLWPRVIQLQDFLLCPRLELTKLVHQLIGSFLLALQPEHEHSLLQHHPLTLQQRPDTNILQRPDKRDCILALQPEHEKSLLQHHLLTLQQRPDTNI